VKTVDQNNSSPAQDLNWGPPKYEAGVLTTTGSCEYSSELSCSMKAGISWLALQLLAFQGGVCSREFVSF
jgi:hypothetical protein